MVSAGPARSTVSMDRGTDSGLFPGMSLCFYIYGDTARRRNLYLKRIGRGRIAEPDRQSSRILPQLNLALIESGLIAITKQQCRHMYAPRHGRLRRPFAWPSNYVSSSRMTGQKQPSALDVLSVPY